MAHSCAHTWAHAGEHALVSGGQETGPAPNIMAVIEQYTKQATHDAHAPYHKSDLLTTAVEYKDRPLVKLKAMVNGCHQTPLSSIMVETYKSEDG